MLQLSGVLTLEWSLGHQLPEPPTSLEVTTTNSVIHHGRNHFLGVPLFSLSGVNRNRLHRKQITISHHFQERPGI